MRFYQCLVFRRDVALGYRQSSLKLNPFAWSSAGSDKRSMCKLNRMRRRTTLKIHAIQTGTVRVKVCQTVGRGRGLMRQVNVLLDRAWTQLLPIYAWAVETRRGSSHC